MHWGFVINTRSGAGVGNRLHQLLRQVYPQLPCWDLAQGSPQAWLRDFAAQLQGIIVCGGDGTINWLAQTCCELGCRIPIAPWPLGTGNDCARALGWESRRATAAGVDDLLQALGKHTLHQVDRWCLQPCQTDAPARMIINYMSIGQDARIAQAFHAQRQRHPGIFRGGLINKTLYGVLALGDSSRSLTAQLSLGGQALPAWCHGVLWSNIASYAGGMQVAPDICADDGHLDCHLVGPRAALALALSPLRRPQSRDSSSALQLHARRPLPMQIDGEPMLLQPGTYRLQHSGSVLFARP